VTGSAGNNQQATLPPSINIHTHRLAETSGSPAAAAPEGGTYELPINEEVVIPLAPALRLGSLSSRRKDEVGAVLVYLKGINSASPHLQSELTLVFST
jgi:hypothetical protein